MLPFQLPHAWILPDPIKNMHMEQVSVETESHEQSFHDDPLMQMQTRQPVDVQMLSIETVSKPMRPKAISFIPPEA